MAAASQDVVGQSSGGEAAVKVFEALSSELVSHVSTTPGLMRWYGCRSSGGRIRSTKSRLRKDQTEGGRQRRQRANRGVEAVKRMSKLAEADTLLRQHKPHPELSHSLSSASHHTALHLLPCCQLFVSQHFFPLLDSKFPHHIRLARDVLHNISSVTELTGAPYCQSLTDAAEKRFWNARHDSPCRIDDYFTPLPETLPEQTSFLHF